MASYDLLIIGAGPAAWSCAMTARQRGLTTAVACAQSATSWLQRAERIDNYPVCRKSAVKSCFHASGRRRRTWAS